MSRDSTSPTGWGVRVPCSTSNLGPGFDLLGLALDLHLEVVAHAAADAAPGPHRIVHLEGGPGTDVAPEDDATLRALRAFERNFDVRLPALALEVRSEIPVGRGFGSSGAAVAAGLLIGAATSGRLDLLALAAREERLAPLACELEGHPDNSTASLLGGCTLGCPRTTDGGLELTIVRAPVHGDIGVALAWPDRALFTPEARRVLPDAVPFADAVENPRRLALLLEGLRTGDPKLLRLGSVDRLHERFRRALIRGADEAIEAALDAGAHAACLSGAGSGLVALGPRGAMQPIADALGAPLEGGRAAVVDVVRDAPRPHAVR